MFELILDHPEDLLSFEIILFIVVLATLCLILLIGYLLSLNANDCRESLKPLTHRQRRIVANIRWNPSGSISYLRLRRKCFKPWALRKTVQIVSEFPKIEELSLTGIKIKDSSIPLLAEAKNVKCLRVIDAEISDEGIDELEKLMPQCRIER
ncbi:MAG: hypothetical protein HUJ26_12335 [Planctomycetaceae bacterium]|nr:hypothetical protein [Planctomycetaceae bacterium]